MFVRLWDDVVLYSNEVRVNYDCWIRDANNEATTKRTSLEEWGPEIRNKVRFQYPSTMPSCCYPPSQLLWTLAVLGYHFHQNPLVLFRCVAWQRRRKWGWERAAPKKCTLFLPFASQEDWAADPSRRQNLPSVLRRGFCSRVWACWIFPWHVVRTLTPMTASSSGVRKPGLSLRACRSSRIWFLKFKNVPSYNVPSYILSTSGVARLHNPRSSGISSKCVYSLYPATRQRKVMEVTVQYALNEYGSKVFPMRIITGSWNARAEE